MYLSPSQMRYSQSSMHVCDMQSTRFVILRGRTKRSFEQTQTRGGAQPRRMSVAESLRYELVCCILYRRGIDGTDTPFANQLIARRVFGGRHVTNA